MHVTVMPNWTLSVMTRSHLTLINIAFSSRLDESSNVFRPIVLYSRTHKTCDDVCISILGGGFVELYPHWSNERAVPKCPAYVPAIRKPSTEPITIVKPRRSQGKARRLL